MCSKRGTFQNVHIGPNLVRSEAPTIGGEALKKKKFYSRTDINIWTDMFVGESKQREQEGGERP